MQVGDSGSHVRVTMPLAPSDERKTLPARKSLVTPALPALPIQTKSRNHKSLKTPNPQIDNGDKELSSFRVPNKFEDSSNNLSTEDAQVNGVVYDIGSEEQQIDTHEPAIGEKQTPTQSADSSNSIPSELDSTTITDLGDASVSDTNKDAINGNVNDADQRGDSEEPENPIETAELPPSLIAVYTDGNLGWAENVYKHEEHQLQKPHVSSQEALQVNGNSLPEVLSEPTPEASTADSRTIEIASISNERSEDTNGGSDITAPLHPQLYSPESRQSHDDAFSSHRLPNAIPTIADHLLQLAATKEWAEWAVIVNARGLQPFVCYAHGLVLTRSPRLRKLMERQHGSSYGGNAINIFPPRTLVPHAFEAALRFLYSDAVLTKDGLFPTNSAIIQAPARAQLLDYVMSYWVAGMELGLEPVATRAASLHQDLMDWDVIEMVMKEGADFAATSRFAHTDTNDEPDYAQLARVCKKSVMNFMASTIQPSSFTLDASAFPTLLRSRFMVLEEPKTRHNPALASMVFGSMPSSTNMSPSSPQSDVSPSISSFVNTTASKILLNLDFHDFEYFCNQWRKYHGNTINPCIEQIVNERESRRLKVISNRAIPNKQRIANSAIWDVAGYHESVVEGHVQRERVGFLLPAKF